MLYSQARRIMESHGYDVSVCPKPEWKRTAQDCLNNAKRNSLGTCVPVKQQETEESTMYTEKTTGAMALNNVIGSSVNIPEPTEQIQMKFLKSSAYNALDEKKRELRVMFGLKDDEYPKSANELIARIKSGNIVLDPFTADADTYGCPLSYIRFRNPAQVYDQKGYDAALKELETKFTDVSREVMINGKDAGLTAVKSLEAFVPSNAPKAN